MTDARCECPMTDKDFDLLTWQFHLELRTKKKHRKPRPPSCLPLPVEEDRLASTMVPYLLLPLYVIIYCLTYGGVSCNPRS